MRSSNDQLARAVLFRTLGLVEGPGESLGIVNAPAVLVDAGVVAAPVDVRGRYYHAVQTTGVAGGRKWKVWASMDGVTYAVIGTEIAADGIQQLPDGLYGSLKAEQSAGAPGVGARIVLASTR